VREAFDYSAAYDTASYDDPQYADSPSGCGYGIYLTKAPTLIDIVAALSRSLKLIEKQLVRKPPLPDPAPDWGSELMASLAMVDALSQRLEVEAATQKQIQQAKASARRTKS
jgi:hypothetical protein